MRIYLLIYLIFNKNTSVQFFSIAKVHPTLGGSNLASLVYYFRRYPKLDSENFQLKTALKNALNLFGIGCTCKCILNHTDRYPLLIRDSNPAPALT